jgi:hypothetical protein
MARALAANGEHHEAQHQLRKGLDLCSDLHDIRMRLLLELALYEDRPLDALDEVWTTTPGSLEQLPIVRALALRERWRAGDERAGHLLCESPMFADCTPEEAARRIPY